MYRCRQYILDQAIPVISLLKETQMLVGRTETIAFHISNVKQISIISDLGS